MPVLSLAVCSDVCGARRGRLQLSSGHSNALNDLENGRAADHEHKEGDEVWADRGLVLLRFEGLWHGTAFGHELAVLVTLGPHNLFGGHRRSKGSLSLRTNNHNE